MQCVVLFVVFLIFTELKFALGGVVAVGRAGGCGSRPGSTLFVLTGEGISSNGKRWRFRGPCSGSWNGFEYGVIRGRISPPEHPTLGTVHDTGNALEQRLMPRKTPANHEKLGKNSNKLLKFPYFKVSRMTSLRFG